MTNMADTLNNRNQRYNVNDVFNNNASTIATSANCPFEHEVKLYIPFDKIFYFLTFYFSKVWKASKSNPHGPLGRSFTEFRITVSTMKYFFIVRRLIKF